MLLDCGRETGPSERRHENDGVQAVLPTSTKQQLFYMATLTETQCIDKTMYWPLPSAFWVSNAVFLYLWMVQAIQNTFNSGSQFSSSAIQGEITFKEGGNQVYDRSRTI
jgi:hypothetical protein